MMERRQTTPALVRLEAALEAACAALIALQAIKTGLRDGETDARTAQAQLGDAIGALRAAIAEFRAFQDAGASMLAFGFVLADDRDELPHAQAAGVS